MNKTTRKLEQSRPSLAQPPRKVDTCPENTGLEGGLEDQPPRSYAPPSTASGTRRRVGPLARKTPVSVVGLTRKANR